MRRSRLLLSAIGSLAVVTLSASAPAQSVSGPGGGEGLGESHTVKPGDTLWDLCAKYLNSPWYWPKIWSYNPQLTNPHWIYPGNEVSFYPGDEELPTQVASGEITVPDDQDLTLPDDDDLVRTVGAIDTGRIGADSVMTTRIAYMSLNAIERSGRVVGSASEAVLLSDYDRIYIQGVGLKEGERLAIFHPMRQIIHPVTGENYGYAVQVVGVVDIKRTGSDVATGIIRQGYRTISRGDYVGPMPKGWNRRVRPVPNQGRAVGFVLETAVDVLGPVGEHNLVYVDRGRAHGVQVGNTFVVYTRGDGYTRETEGYPNEVVATVMVLDVQDNASTAIVTASAREFTVGDRVEMRPGN